MTRMVFFFTYLTMLVGVAIRVQQRTRPASQLAQNSSKAIAMPAETIVMNIKTLGTVRSGDLCMSCLTQSLALTDKQSMLTGSASKNWSPEGTTTLSGEMAFQFGIPNPTQKYHYRFWHKAATSSSAQVGGFVYYSGSLDEAIEKEGRPDVLVFNHSGNDHTPGEISQVIGANVVTLSSKFEKDSSVASNMLRVPAGDWHFVPTARKWPRPSHEERIKLNLKRSNILPFWQADKALPEGRLSDVFGLPVQNYLWLPGGMSGDFVRYKRDAARCNAYGAFLVTFEGNPRTWLYCMAWRKVMDEPVYPCNGLMSHSTMSFIAEEYIQLSGAISTFSDLVSDNSTTSSMMLLLGGSGAGKSTLIKRLSECSDAQVNKWVMSGLDEFLDWIPEYIESVKDPFVGYTKAADKCYWPEAIGIAQKVNRKSTVLNLPLILEDTGKDLKRSIEFVKTLGSGRHVTIAMVDNDPENAVSRAMGRFQMTGRWSPAEYIRESFAPVWNTFQTLEAMHGRGEFPAPKMSFIYCDNSRHFDARCWLKSGDSDLWPSSCFEQTEMKKL